MEPVISRGSRGHAILWCGRTWRGRLPAVELFLHRAGVWRADINRLLAKPKLLHPVALGTPGSV
jgi:hypothetical protein